MTATSLSAAHRPSIELLWFEDCPNHAAARQMLIELVPIHAPGSVVRIIDATEPTVAASHRFPGSPTIRVDGVDIDPAFVEPGDYTPRCRLYQTSEGLRGLPEPAWIEAALRSAIDRRGSAPSTLGAPGRRRLANGATGARRDAQARADPAGLGCTGSSCARRIATRPTSC